MSATFACPWCRATYPVKPVLVGRVVRCTTCKNAFCLQANGVADQVAAVESAPPQSRPTVLALEPAPPSPPTAPSSPAPAASPAPTTSARPSTAVLRRTEQLTKAQEESRKSLSANLASAASEALHSEVVLREQAADERKRKESERKRSRSDGGVGRISSAILTGEGAREQRSHKQWLIGVLVVGGLVALIVLATSHRSPERMALDAFVAPTGNVHSDRSAEHKSRAWTPTAVAVFTDLGSVSISSARGVDIKPAQAVLADINGLSRLVAFDVWAPPDQHNALRLLWAKARNPVERAPAPCKTVEHTALVKRLNDAVHDDDAVRVLKALALDNPSGSNDTLANSLLRSGKCPDRMEIAPFHGRGRWLKQDSGFTSKSEEVFYSGFLVRFVGTGWPAEWKVFEFKPELGP